METNPKLILELRPDGSLQISGPIGNKQLCYGMLEMGKDAVRDYNAEQSRRTISLMPNIFPKGKLTDGI